jgi:hypothetical protein
MQTRKTPGGAEYVFTRHALDQMERRGIKRKEIEAVLDGNHITDYPDTKGNRCLVSPVLNGRRLRIVVDKRTNPIEVVTAIVLD